MAWQTPKTDWSASDGVRDADFNRIEGNILELYNKHGLNGALTLYVNGATGDDTTGVGTAALPYKTIMKAVRSLPKSLGGYNANISIAAGTYAEQVDIESLAGKIIFTGASGAAVNITSLRISACICIINSINLSASASGYAIDVTNGGTLICTSNKLSASNTSMSNIAVNVSNVSSMYVANTLNITGMGGGTALNCTHGSTVHVSTLTGSNKANGIEAANGGKVSYVLNQFVASGTLLATYTGGRIYTGAQTSIANY